MILEGLIPVRGPKMQVSLVSRAMHLWMGTREEDYGQMWLWKIMGGFTSTYDDLYQRPWLAS